MLVVKRLCIYRIAVTEGVARVMWRSSKGLEVENEKLQVRVPVQELIPPTHPHPPTPRPIHVCNLTILPAAETELKSLLQNA